MSVSKEEMLEWTCRAHALFPDDINTIYAIRARIEHGPEVSRGTIEFLIFGPDIWKDCDKDTINALIFYLHSQGVEEKK